MFKMETALAQYETKATLFFVRMYDGKRQTLIGLDENDYRMLLMNGFKDEEVYLGLRRVVDSGSDYTLEVRASLNTIKVEGDPYFQLRLDIEPTSELLERGFKDGEEAFICVKMSPYRIPSQQLKPEDVALNVFDESDPMLDAPEVWLQ